MSRGFYRTPAPTPGRVSSRLNPGAGERELGRGGTTTAAAVSKRAEAGTRAGLCPKARVCGEAAPQAPRGRPRPRGALLGGKGRGLAAPRTGRGGGRGERGGAGRPGPAAGRRNSPLLPACGARVARIPRSSDAEIRTRSNPSAIFAAAATAAATPPPPRAARKPRRTGGARSPTPTLFPAPSCRPPQTTVAALGAKAFSSFN